MLDDYIDLQKIPYRIIKNSVEKNKISHAYIIETNGFSKSLDFAIAISKYFLCPKSRTNNESCNSCNQCSKIDNNDFLELKIIDTEGMWIKKGEMDELQEIFSRKSLIGKRKIYIINNANKLNESSSNSILKFLEEPEEGITAILIVEKTNQLISTIVSRCQIISLVPNLINEDKNTLEKVAHILRNNDNDVNIYLSEKNEAVKQIVQFIKYYEENKLNTIIYINKLWHQFFKERTELNDAFTLLMLFYKDVLNYKIGYNIEVFNDYIEDIKIISNTNQKNNIINKINVIMELREKIKFNVNNNLLLDKLIIELEGCE